MDNNTTVQTTNLTVLNHPIIITKMDNKIFILTTHPTIQTMFFIRIHHCLLHRFRIGRTVLLFGDICRHLSGDVLEDLNN